MLRTCMYRAYSEPDVVLYAAIELERAAHEAPPGPERDDMARDAIAARARMLELARAA